jgi:hypothetical protein
MHSSTPTMAHVSSVLRALSATHGPLATHVPSIAHALALPWVPAASIATANLWAGLNHCRDGEDSRITIERQRERCRNIEGEFDSLVLAREVPTAHDVHPPSSPGLLGGCMELAAHLHMVVWPHKFRPHLPEKYDGTVNLVEFL